MRRSRKVLIIVALAIVLVFGTVTTAFAVGETLHHDGYSRYSYVSDNYVPQMWDTRLQNDRADLSPTNAIMICSAVVYDGRRHSIHLPYQWDHGL